MNEKTKNILSWVLSILFVGSIITSLVIKPRISLAVIGYIALGAFALLILSYMVSCLKVLLYVFLAAVILRRYIANIYQSFMNRGDRCSMREVMKYVQSAMQIVSSSVLIGDMKRTVTAKRELTYISKIMD